MTMSKCLHQNVEAIQAIKFIVPFKVVTRCLQSCNKVEYAANLRYFQASSEQGCCKVVTSIWLDGGL